MNSIDNDKYQMITHGEEKLIYERTTQKLFFCELLNNEGYRKFMDLAARIESAKKHYPMDEFREIK